MITRGHLTKAQGGDVNNHGPGVEIATHAMRFVAIATLMTMAGRSFYVNASTFPGRRRAISRRVARNPFGLNPAAIAEAG